MAYDKVYPQNGQSILTFDSNQEDRVASEFGVQDTYSKDTRKELRKLHTIPPVATGNFNAYYQYGGTYRVASSMGNAPRSGASYGFLEVISSYGSDGWCLQRFTDILNYITYTRVLRSTWSDWKAL